MKMEQFETVLMRHGEAFVQHLMETWERYQGLRATAPLPLEARWERFLRATDFAPAVIAA